MKTGALSNDVIFQNQKKHLSCNFTQMWSTVVPVNWHIELFHQLNSYGVIMN